MADAHNTPDEGSKPVPIPWDEPGGRGPVGLAQTLRQCLRRPDDFFRRVPLSEERWGPLGFAVIMHVLGFSAAAAWIALFDREQLTVALIRVAIAPLWVLVAVWGGSELMHAWLALVKGVRHSRSVTHRAVAYCYSTAAFCVIPTVWGTRAALLAAAVFQVIALSRAHGTSIWKGLFAVLLTWFTVVVAIVILVAGELEGQALE